MTDETIPLPEPKGPYVLTGLNPNTAERTFTADQVRAAVMQERERCAKVCDAETQIAHGEFGAGWVEGARACASAIRSGHSITETTRAEE